ncbi:hypothetical protein M569_02154, partial [Genlisea aurea]
LHGVAEWGQQQQQQQQTISLDWTPQEQAILEEGLITFGCESSIIRYAKIAVLLKNKSVRDVAFRCRWMAKKESSPSPHANTTVAAARRVQVQVQVQDKKVVVSKVLPLQTTNLLHIIFFIPARGYTQQLLQQNIWTFKQITANLATHQ